MPLSAIRGNKWQALTSAPHQQGKQHLDRQALCPERPVCQQNRDMLACKGPEGNATAFPYPFAQSNKDKQSR